ncbi:hypothetical protein ABIC65_000884 [Sphingomonas trueperi]|uniref:hypothetical protein n=1 Tax=Sphingomonas trueperi TaxID=53317 RepID=UPI00339730F6
MLDAMENYGKVRSTQVAGNTAAAVEPRSGARSIDQEKYRMSVDRLGRIGSGVPVECATRLLEQNWPRSTLLTPADIGLGGRETAVAEFLGMVESLSDAGFLAYEALVFNSDGPMLVDATLTARGRAMLASEANQAN